MNATSVVARVFDGVAAGYDAAPLQRLVYRPNQEVVVGHLSRLNAQRIADVGCGTGVMTALIAAQLTPAALYGCDPSAGMLAKARERSADVEWLTVAAERLPFADGALDAVVTTEAFHFFDQPAALAEFHRVLAPGGHVIIASANVRHGLLGAALRLTPVSFPTAGRVRGLLDAAGFDVLEQRQVGRLLTTLFPTTATLARRPITRSEQP